MNYTTGNWSHCSRWLTAALVLGLLAPLGTARAQAAAATVTCKDGTTSTTTGKGACSHHGGVDKGTAAGATAPAPAAPAAPAAATTAMVTCKDGTSSNAGRGACSHHGGVGTASAAAPATKVMTTAPPTKVATAPAPAVAPAPAAAPKAPVVASSAGKVGSSETTDATGAIAQCKDGLYSHSHTHTGTCSGHGGVAKWLDGTAK